MTEAPLRATSALAGSVALGALASSAFDPLSVPFAMVLSIAGWLWVLRRLDTARKRLVIASGLLYGLAFMAPLIWWMNAVSPGAYVALVVAQTLFFAPTALALRAVLRLRAWPLWAAGVWVAMEWGRSSFPFTGFPWGRLAHTAIDTPFESYARLLGMPGTSAVLVLLAAGVLAAVEGARLRGAATVVVLVVIGLLLPVGLVGDAGSRQVAIVQGDTPGEFLQWPPGAIFALHADETQRLAESIERGDVPRPDLVLWPENSTDSDPTDDPLASGRIEGLSRRIGAPILVGGLFDGPTPTTSYNAGQVWTEDGPGERYVKRRPVPYGEYVPFRGALGGVVPQFDRDIPRDMLAGDRPGTLDVADTIIGDSICYDIAYDDVTRDLVDGRAQVLVVQTSNAAFTGTSQPEQQWDISRLRAIETGRWVLVPSTNGISGVIDARGDAVQRAPIRVPATLEQRVPLAAGRTPSAVVEAPLEIALIVVGLLGWALGARQLRVRRRARA